MMKVLSLYYYKKEKKMKILCSILIWLIVFTSVSTNRYDNNEEIKIFKSIYETHGNEMSEEELNEYYKKYNVSPSNVSGYNGYMTDEDKVSNYLKTNDPEGKTWTLSESDIYNVSKVISIGSSNEYNPSSVSRYFKYIEKIN